MTFETDCFFLILDPGGNHIAFNLMFWWIIILSSIQSEQQNN